jgi:tetrahydromethanopterin S-methyltransferase subunit F
MEKIRVIEVIITIQATDSSADLIEGILYKQQLVRRKKRLSSGSRVAFQVNFARR